MQRLRLAVYLFCGLLSLWLIASVVLSVVAGLRHDRAVDPFTGHPAQTSGPSTESGPP